MGFSRRVATAVHWLLRSTYPRGMRCSPRARRRRVMSLMYPLLPPISAAADPLPGSGDVHRIRPAPGSMPSRAVGLVGFAHRQPSSAG